MTSSHSGTTRVVDSQMGVVRTVAVDVYRLPTVKAKVVAALTIVFCKGDNHLS